MKSIGGPSAPMRKFNKPKYSRFTQQEFPACKPVLTPTWVISTFTCVGFVFVLIGVAALIASENVVEIVDRYDTTCIPEWLRDDKLAYIQNSETNKTCTRTLIVPKFMKAPVYVYYQLDNFYQNHRRYAKSLSVKQLRNIASEQCDIKDCRPEDKTPNGSAIVPCGLIAWSLFNDTYKFSSGGKTLEVSKKDIAWKADREHMFGKNMYPKNFQAGGLIGGGKLNASIPCMLQLSEQTDLIIWMRLAALPRFRKLYGKIETDIKQKEKLYVVIQNNYNTYSFGGKKNLVLSTTSWIGGKNKALGIAYFAIGGLCLLFAVSFMIYNVFKPRPLGDPSYLSWNKAAVGRSI